MQIQHCDNPLTYPQTGRCFYPPPTHSSTQPPSSLSLRQGQWLAQGHRGWQWCIRLMYRTDGQGWELAVWQVECSPSFAPPLAPCSPLLFCTIPRHQHPSGWWPIALLPNKNSPSHYSSASPGAARSPASLPGLRIWLCRHHLALPLLSPHSSNYRSSTLFVNYKTFVLIKKTERNRKMPWEEEEFGRRENGHEENGGEMV